MFFFFMISHRLGVFLAFHLKNTVFFVVIVFLGGGGCKIDRNKKGWGTEGKQ